MIEMNLIKEGDINSHYLLAQVELERRTGGIGKME